MNHHNRLRAELDAHELASLQRFMVALHEEVRESNPRVEMTRIFRGTDGQIFVPVAVSGTTPDAHLAMLMEHKAEQLYKQSGCRFVLLQQLEADPQLHHYFWSEGSWQTVP
jgi:hypothetical protein